LPVLGRVWRLNQRRLSRQGREIRRMGTCGSPRSHRRRGLAPLRSLLPLSLLLPLPPLLSLLPLLLLLLSPPLLTHPEWQW